MKEIRATGYGVRGLIGEDFLSHFDATIDNTHNRVCFIEASSEIASRVRPGSSIKNSAK
jgi:hypothetical protein